MSVNITISGVVPFVTAEKYAQMVGLDKSTVHYLMDEGVIPEKQRQIKNGRVIRPRSREVNLLAIYAQAAVQGGIKVNTVIAHNSNGEENDDE